MAIQPTRYSRVSIGFLDSVRSIADVDPADTGAVFSATGPWAMTGALTQTGAATFSSTVSIGGALTQDAAATFLSTATFAGNVTATSGLLVGNAAAVNELVAVSTATAALSFGAIAALGTSSTVTAALSGATRGDSIFVTPDANWHRAADNTLVSVYASSGSTSGEISVWAINSGQSSITPTAASVFRFTRINHPSYL